MRRLFPALAFILIATAAQAGGSLGCANPVADSCAQQMLDALQSGDHAKFIEKGDATFKVALTQEQFNAVVKQFQPRMTAGYTPSYLGQLKQKGLDVFLIKLEFKDGGDDFLTKLVMRGGEVAGFWIQ